MRICKLIVIIEAINKTYQSTVNRMYIAERKYNDLVDATSRLEDVSKHINLDDDKAWAKSMRKQEDMWCKFMDYLTTCQNVSNKTKSVSIKLYTAIAAFNNDDDSLSGRH